MKHSFLMKSALFLAVALLFAACEPESETNSFITFEDVQLDSTGYWNGNDLSGTPYQGEVWGMPATIYAGSFTSGILKCNNEFIPSDYPSWYGLACSNHHDQETIGFGNQYSTYASAGANGSQKFALLYLSGNDSIRCEFEQEVYVKNLMYNNSTYTYKAVAEGLDGFGGSVESTRFLAGDYMYVVVTGYDASNNKTNSVMLSLAEFRNGSNYVCASWTRASLSSLGKVKSLAFNFVSTRELAPSYCCIDNIEYSID